MNCKQILAVCLILSTQVLRAENLVDAVKRSGTKGGIVVHIGCGDGSETADMLLNRSYLVHGLDTSNDNVARARAYLHSRNLYGSVSVARYDGKSLPYSDNIVNLIVAETLGDVPLE
ncbi:MAG: class I SAM-dependent methyltransferase, partial [Planctomycetota bacterium]